MCGQSTLPWRAKTMGLAHAAAKTFRCERLARVVKTMEGKRPATAGLPSIALSYKGNRLVTRRSTLYNGGAKVGPRTGVGRGHWHGGLGVLRVGHGGQ